MKSIATLIASLVVTVALAQIKPVTTPPASKATTTAVKSPGQTIYEQHCLTCHQANGSGVPNLNPPLRNVDWVTGDKTQLINVLLKGLQGQEIDGETYDNVMPAHDFLTDQQLADVLTYIRSSFGNKASEIKPEEVKALREKK